MRTTLGQGFPLQSKQSELTNSLPNCATIRVRRVAVVVVVVVVVVAVVAVVVVLKQDKKECVGCGKR